MKESMDFMAEAPPLPDLILSLEQATCMAKQLPSTTDQTHLLQIYTSLHTAHRNLSNFLCRIDFPPPAAAAENSFSSATGVNQDGNGNEPMEVGDDDDEVEADEEISKGAVAKVEEKMRDCFIKNKRPKRPLSPSTAAAAEEERRLSDDGFIGRVKDFDAHAMRLRALDLVYQFHG